VEVVDIKNKEDLWEQWDPFIVRTYLDHEEDYYKSRISRYPRRSCEALFAQTVYGQFVENWLGPLINAERKK